MTTVQKRSFWKNHIDGWQHSGLSQPEYCKQHDIKLATFGYWRTRLKKPQPVNRLIPVTLPNTSHIRISLPNGIGLSLPVHVLADVLPVLNQSVEGK